MTRRAATDLSGGTGIAARNAAGRQRVYPCAAANRTDRESKSESRTARHDSLGRRCFLRRITAAGAGWLASLSAAGQGRGGEPASARAALFTSPTRTAIAKGLAFLAARQNADGAFGTGSYGQNVAVCGLGGMAFLAAGHLPARGPYGATLDRCLSFILQHTAENGYIFAAEGASRGPMYGHGFATLFLSEAYGAAPHRELRQKLERAVRLIVDTQNAEGGWRYEPRRYDADISVTVCQVMALRAAHNAGVFVPNETIARAVEYVQRSQNPDGGFMYQLSQPGVSEFPRSAAAIVALYSAGIYEGEEIRQGLDYLMRFPPRPNVRGEQAYYMYGHYYAVQAMWHAGGTYWAAWYPAIRDVLLKEQRNDGAWFDTISPEYGTAMATLVLQMPENYLPIFQR